MAHNRGAIVTTPQPKKKKATGRPFEKGNNANPGGRPKKDPKIAAFQISKYEDFIENMQIFGDMPMRQLSIEKNNEDMPAFAAVCANIVYDAAWGGKEFRKDARQILLERIWGKPKETDLNPFTDLHDMMKQIPLSELVGLMRNAQGHQDLRDKKDA